MTTLRFFFDRLHRYYGKHGFYKSLKRFCQKAYFAIFKSSAYIYYCDLSDLDPSDYRLPDNYQFEVRESADQILGVEMDSLAGYIGRDILMHQLKERFSRSALLWLGKVEGKVAYFAWTIRQKPLKPYYLPLGDLDALIFDGGVFHGYRGRNINPVFLTQLFCALKKRGLKRALVDVFEWNQSSIHSLTKTPVKLLGIARKVYLPGKNVILWKE